MPDAQSRLNRGDPFVVSAGPSVGDPVALAFLPTPAGESIRPNKYRGLRFLMLAYREAHRFGHSTSRRSARHQALSPVPANI